MLETLGDCLISVEIGRNVSIFVWYGAYMQDLKKNGSTGLDMSFLTGQDWTPKFAGEVLPNRTKSGLIFLNILNLPSMGYQFSSDKVPGHKYGVIGK